MPYCESNDCLTACDCFDCTDDSHCHLDCDLDEMCEGCANRHSAAEDDDFEARCAQGLS